MQKAKIHISVLIIFTIALLTMRCNFELPLWIIEEITIKAQDGLPLEAYLLRPQLVSEKYPAVICFHQCWGNRDDFLKLFPFFAEAGIIAISANYPRLAPTLDPRRHTDLANTIDYALSLDFIDKNRIGIITSSLSVNAGLIAIRNKKNVIADVMLSGPILDEESKKWLTINSNLAIFPITSIYDGYNHIFMKEYIRRNTNPYTRHLFLDDTSNRFSINAHGTFIFDEYPNSILKIQKFFMEVFNINKRNHGYLKKILPKDTIVFHAIDKMPIIATIKKPHKPTHSAIILYPPRYQNRTFYSSYIEKLAEKNILVFAPNTKRTCRSENKLYLCEREIMGAVNYLSQNQNINKVIIVFPSFYFLAAKSLIANNKLLNGVFVFAETGDHNYGVKPKNITNSSNKIYHLKHLNIQNLIKIVEAEYE